MLPRPKSLHTSRSSSDAGSILRLSKAALLTMYNADRSPARRREANTPRSCSATVRARACRSLVKTANGCQKRPITLIPCSGSSLNKTPCLRASPRSSTKCLKDSIGAMPIDRLVMIQQLTSFLLLQHRVRLLVFMGMRFLLQLLTLSVLCRRSNGNGQDL